jgi:PPK2 family polyphosphate:nucleotide phosphotransferase
MYQLKCPHGRVDLKDYDPDFTMGIDKSDAKKELRKNCKVLETLGYKLYAEDKRSLLVVLQGMDTAGKDGVIKRVLKGLHAQSTQVTSFKQPGAEELNHDFLWRAAKALPSKGVIGIFNRSYYEDVLVVRVHHLMPNSYDWDRRFAHINLFEEMLATGDISVVKIFLHISKQEQRDRLQSRLDNPDKSWKFSEADLKERELWDDYQKAYMDVLSKCNKPHAPWYVIPANHKWIRDLIVSRVLIQTLQTMDPKFPASNGPKGLKIR